MWIALSGPDGFLSVVESEHDTAKLTVRARAIADLDAFRTAHAPGLGPTIMLKNRDYPARAEISKTEFAEALARAAAAISYKNYKGSLRDPLRARIFAKAWSVFRELERLNDPDGA